MYWSVLQVEVVEPLGDLVHVAIAMSAIEMVSEGEAGSFGRGIVTPMDLGDEMEVLVHVHGNTHIGCSDSGVLDRK